jgi:enoyl-[acyl-carrier protein] reductase II
VLRTPVCDLLGIDVPIIGAPFGPWDQVDLAAAISGAGALGSVGTALRPLPELQAQWQRVRELTDRPFAINHTIRPFTEETFAATLDFGPAAISFHLGVPGEEIARAHDRRILWIQQVVDLRQAEEAVAAGADVIIAQGGEAGGHAGSIATMVLVPQVVDAPATSRSSPRAASRTGAGWPPRWRSAPRASAWEPDSSPRASWRSPTSGSSAWSMPTRPTP